MEDNSHTRCLFVSDLHGSAARYRRLFEVLRQEKPAALFLGGDLLPSGLARLSGLARFSKSLSAGADNFIHDFLAVQFEKLRQELKASYPAVFLILGNDDARFEESSILDVGTAGLWHYMHNRRLAWRGYDVYGYACIPPTPFRLKDWERYDVSRYTDPGCTAPFEGSLTVPVSESELQFSTIKDDLVSMTKERDLSKSLFLFHTPPYQTGLDRAALDGRMIDYVPLDVHVGSIAVKRFIENRQPLVTMHGHVHESSRLTDMWQERIKDTFLFSAAYEAPDLAVVRFDPADPASAERVIYPPG